MHALLVGLELLPQQDYYVVLEDFTSYYGDGYEGPGNACPIDASEISEDKSSMQLKQVTSLSLSFSEYLCLTCTLLHFLEYDN